YASWQILDVFHRADAMGMPRPIVGQEMYNLLVRQLDIEFFKFTRAFPIHTTVYNPLAGGLLTPRHLAQVTAAAREPAAAVPAPITKTHAPSPGSRFATNRLYAKRYWTSRFFAETEAYADVAQRAGMTLVELAYRFVASVPQVDSVL